MEQLLADQPKSVSSAPSVVHRHPHASYRQKMTQSVSREPRMNTDQAIVEHKATKKTKGCALSRSSFVSFCSFTLDFLPLMAELARWTYCLRNLYCTSCWRAPFPLPPPAYRLN
jgi:hypothetical protein